MLQEGKGWEAAWKVNKALAQWVEQTQTTDTPAQANTGTVPVPNTMGLLSVLMQKETEVAMKQWPTIMGAKAQARHL